MLLTSLRTAVAEDTEHDLVVFGRIGGPVDHGAATNGFALELFQIVGQPREHVGFDLRGTFAQMLPLRERLRGLVAFGADEPQRLVVPLGAGTVADELGGQRCVIHSGCPARISATCITRSGLRWR